MLPLIITNKQTILLQGDGPATTHRMAFLEEAGMAFEHIKNHQPLTSNHQLVFIADFDDDTSKALYNHYKAQGALVNAEDKTRFCDFHVPARVRRGDLLLTVSTAGGSPRVAKRIRIMLENLFPQVWKEKLNQLAKERNGWKKEGASFTELATKTDTWLDHEGLLKAECPCLRSTKEEV